MSTYTHTIQIVINHEGDLVLRIDDWHRAYEGYSSGATLCAGDISMALRESRPWDEHDDDHDESLVCIWDELVDDPSCLCVYAPADLDGHGGHSGKMLAAALAAFDIDQF